MIDDQEETGFDALHNEDHGDLADLDADFWDVKEDQDDESGGPGGGEVIPETHFGRHQTRERQTELDYTEISIRLWAAYEREAREGVQKTDSVIDDQAYQKAVCATPMGVVNWMIARKQRWAKPTWRRYKSAMIYYLRSVIGDGDALMASDRLESVTSNGCKSETQKSSATRIKSVSRAEFMRFIACFGEVVSPRHRYAGLAKTWMLMGCITGLRPHEWGQAQLLTRLSEDHELVVSGHLKAGMTYLRVKNSKHTNGRANGAYRHLDVSSLPEGVWGAMDALIRILSDRVRYPAIYNNCRRFVADANRHFFGREKGRRFHLYTSRHRFASEAKNALSSDQVAAAMGHGSDQTAYSAYGTSKFSSGGAMAAPVENEVKTVKRHAARKKPYVEQGANDKTSQG